MTNAEMQTMLQTMTGETDEQVLSAYLSLAENVVLTHAYPYDEDATEVPTRYQMVQVEIAAYMLNKRGAEGETSHSENGVTRSYEDGDIPPTLLRRIVPAVGVLS